MDILGYNQHIIIGYHRGYFPWILDKDKKDNQIGQHQGYLIQISILDTNGYIWILSGYHSWILLEIFSLDIELG
jgi:hypothetical protein